VSSVYAEQTFNSGNDASFAANDGGTLDKLCEITLQRPIAMTDTATYGNKTATRPAWRVSAKDAAKPGRRNIVQADRSQTHD